MNGAQKECARSDRNEHDGHEYRRADDSTYEAGGCPGSDKQPVRYFCVRMIRRPESNSSKQDRGIRRGGQANPQHLWPVVRRRETDQRNEYDRAQYDERMSDCRRRHLGLRPGHALTSLYLKHVTT
jgi:hypothetical protein